MSSIRFLNLAQSFKLVNQRLNKLANIQSNFQLIKQEKRTLFTSLIDRTDKESNKNEKPSEGEQKLIDLLKARFPKAKTIEVVDISGGCGAMYTVYVETNEFKNLRTVKQHQLINDVLKNEIRNNMHGLRIQTAVPKE